MQYNKLVRDKIPDVIHENGEEAVFHIARDDEYWEKLKEKVLEEFQEFIADESLEEVADLMEVLHAVAAFKGFDLQQIDQLRQTKNEKRGAFVKRIILEKS